MKKKKFTIDKKEKKWLRALVISGLGWVFIVKPLTTVVDGMLPNGFLRYIVGILLILAILLIWEVRP